MSFVLRALILASIFSLVSAAAANAGAQPHMGPTKIMLADGKTAFASKNSDGKWQLFFLNGDGKQIPAPPGNYKQKGGNVIKVQAGGFVDPHWMIEFNPQPDPPGLPLGH